MPPCAVSSRPGLASCAPLAPAPPLAPELPRREPLVRVGLLVDTTEVELGATTDLEIADGGTGRVLHRLAPGARAVVRSDERGELVFGAAMPEGWVRLRTLLLLGGSPVGEKPAELEAVVTGELIPAVNHFDREKVRQQARAARP